MTTTNLRDWWEELLQIHEFNHYRDYADELTRVEADFIEQALSLRGVESILDLACGGGRHSIELARRGYAVEGLDVVASVVAHARARAAELGVNVRFVLGDMRSLEVEPRFDAILIMNSSLGFFDDATNEEVLANAARLLVPGGRLLIQCLNPYQISAYLNTFRSGWYPVGRGYILREAHFEPREAALVIRYRYIEPEQGLDVEHPGDHIRLYGFPELRAMLERVGLRLHSVFGDTILPPVIFGEESQWQVLVAVRDRLLMEESEDTYDGEGVATT